MRHNSPSILAVGLLAILTGCAETTDEILFQPEEAAWVQEAGKLLIEAVEDGLADYEAADPSYSAPLEYPPIDLTGLSYGVAGGFLYLRVDLAAPIPPGPVPLPRAGQVEEQVVRGQSLSLRVETDGDAQTGTETGIDIVFAIDIEYGKPPEIQARYDFVEGDETRFRGRVDGEFGGGGPGKDHVIVRYDTASIPVGFWPYGSEVEVWGLATARSDLYSTAAGDRSKPVEWKIPPLD